jgi:hypothetical protein
MMVAWSRFWNKTANCNSGFQVDYRLFAPINPIFSDCLFAPIVSSMIVSFYLSDDFICSDQLCNLSLSSDQGINEF